MATTSPTVRQAPAKPLGGSAKMVLFNVLGELVMPSGRRAPTAALLKPLEAMGYTHYAARQAIQRCGGEGWIDSVREGRESHWALTASGGALLTDGIERVEALAQDVEDWDGTWLVVFVSIPHERRAIRDPLLRTLRWGGLGSPAPGVWVSPHADRHERVRAAITSYHLEASTLSFTGVPSGVGLSEEQLVAQAWDLEALAGHYEDLVVRFGAMRPKTPADVMRALLELDEQLQPMPIRDPQLPSSLVPTWSGRPRAATLIAVRERWLTQAREHWSTLLEG